jgi:tRNA (cytidine/uridine-2'-O-)-methyltransferase
LPTVGRQRDHLFLFEDDGAGGTVYDPAYPAGAYLVFGQETKGLPDSIVSGLSDRVFAFR